MKSNVVKMKEARQSTVGGLKGSGGERSEPEVPERPPTVAATTDGDRPDPEVRVPLKRRVFSNSYKLRFLEKADAAGQGGIGALLRKEGLYSSNLSAWRKQRDKGKLAPRSAKNRGPQPLLDKATRQKIVILEKENSRLAKRLKRAEQIIEIQKKISELMGIPQPVTPIAEND